MRVSKVIISVNSNVVYREFWPIVSKAWTLINIDPVLVDCLTEEEIENNKFCGVSQEYGKIIRFIIPKELAKYSVFVSQCIRLLIPSLFFPDDICMFSDADLLPLNAIKYFNHDCILNIDVTENKILILRPFDKIPEGNGFDYHKRQIPMCYNIASGKTFQTIFRIAAAVNPEEFLKNRLREWYSVCQGDWTSDQQLLHLYVTEYQRQFPDRVVYFGDALLNFSRLDRSSPIFLEDPSLINEYKRDILPCTDFHMPRPINKFKDAIASVLSFFEKPMVYYISFSTMQYAASQKNLTRSLHAYGKTVIEFTSDFIMTQDHPKLSDELKAYPFIRTPKRTLFETYPDIFQERRGFGFWAWKAWMLYIMITFYMKANDILIYLDSGMEALADPTPLEKIVQTKFDQAMFYVPGEHPISKWTKQDCIDEICKGITDIHKKQQVLGGFQVYRKTEKTTKFIYDLLNYCCSIRLISDTVSESKNDPEFKEHRHDQAILSLLVYRDLSKEQRIGLFRDPSQWGNDFPETNSVYPQLFFLHRNNFKETTRQSNYTSSDPWLTGNSIKAHCDLILDDTTDSFIEPKCFFQNCLAFVKTDYLYSFIRDIHPKIDTTIEYSLATHNSDLPVCLSDVTIREFIQGATNLKHWFATNVNFFGSPGVHKISSIPIGFANSDWKHGDTRVLAGAFRNRMDFKKKKSKIYVNFNVQTNPDVRQKVLDACMSKNQYFQVSSPSLSFAKYLDEMDEYKFILCPQGNGLDTHRIWEAYLVGSIPIIIYDESKYKPDQNLWQPSILLGLAEFLNCDWPKVCFWNEKSETNDRIWFKNWNTPSYHIYIMFYKKNTKRLTYLLNYFKQNGIHEYTIVNTFDQEELTEKDIQKWHKHDQDIILFLPDPEIQYFRARPLKRSEISLAIKHLTTIFTIATDTSPRQNYLLIEDDCIFDTQNVTSILLNLPTDFSIGYISESCNLHLGPSEPAKYKWVKHKYKRSRGTGAFVITKNCCHSIYQNFTQFTMPIDWELMLLHYKLDHQVYWLEPPIIKNGSEIGIYERSI
jgi:hypothetical protein